MDCEACNGLLLDHLYGELDEARAAAVREHLDACETCAGAFDRLSRGRRAAQALTVVEAPAPDAVFLAAIRAAAEAQAPPESAPVASVVSLDAARPRFPRWLQRAGEVAMRRQVAMAAMFLLMVGFGLSYQFQAPTRPLQNVDEPAARVIPAHELPSPEGSEAPTPVAAPRRAPSTRSPVLAERGPDHRTVPPRSAQAPAVTPTTPSGPSPEQQQADPVNDENARDTATVAVGRADNTVDPQPTYRALTPPAGFEAGNIATNQRLTNDPALNRGMPSLPVDNRAAQTTWQSPTQAALAQNTLQVQAAQDGSSWQSARDTGRTQHAQGRNEAAIAAYRRALELDPPEAERTSIARDLYQALQESGHAREASDVYARYLMRANNATELANQMRVAPQVSQERPSVAHPSPSRPASRRMRQSAPAANDAYNNLGF